MSNLDLKEEICLNKKLTGILKIFLRITEVKGGENRLRVYKYCLKT
jgi:hypothetical protein